MLVDLHWKFAQEIIHEKCYYKDIFILNFRHPMSKWKNERDLKQKQNVNTL
jgi:hypothetical protein